MENNTKLKRQAVWATFTDILDEEQLIQVINTLEEDYSGDDIASLIKYVKQIGHKFAIDQALIISLYTKLYSYINTRGVALPEDPLIRIQSRLKRSGKGGLAQSVEDKHPEMVVFLYFMQRVLIHFPLNRKQLLSEMAVLVKKEKSFTLRDKETMAEWLKDPDTFQWTYIPMQESMSTLIHFAYTVLCDLSGPVEADTLFHQVLEDCKQLPAAKKFNPRRFL